MDEFTKKLMARMSPEQVLEFQRALNEVRNPADIDSIRMRIRSFWFGRKNDIKRAQYQAARDVIDDHLAENRRLREKLMNVNDPEGVELREWIDRIIAQLVTDRKRYDEDYREDHKREQTKERVRRFRARKKGDK